MHFSLPTISPTPLLDAPGVRIPGHQETSLAPRSSRRGLRLHKGRAWSEYANDPRCRAPSLRSPSPCSPASSRGCAEVVQTPAMPVRDDNSCFLRRWSQVSATEYGGADLWLFHDAC